MKIAVLFGGLSEEREVSAASAGQVVKALRAAGHSVAAVDLAFGALDPKAEADLLRAGVAPLPPHQDDLARLKAHPNLAGLPEIKAAEVVFLALHGGTGEDGTVQAVLDMADIPYTGSGHLASALAMDKDVSKQVLRFARIPTPDWRMAGREPGGVDGELEYPLVVKPNAQGSTIGLSIVQEPRQLAPAIDAARGYGPEVMLERYIDGRELTVGILDDRPLTVGEIIPRLSTIFDYRSKYQEGGADEIFPADLTTDATRTIRALALKAHRALKLEGYSRVDFRMDGQGRFWCLEANTLPGMTTTSLLPQSAAGEGLGFAQLCERICLLGLERYRRRKGVRIPAEEGR